MNYPLFLFFGFVPSILWLLFYLRKDTNPEPNWMIKKVFFWGMLATIPAIGIELAAREVIQALPFTPPVLLVLYVFFGIALVEEFLKFLVVRVWVFSNSAMDEPVDLMLYMIISALGFAALENIFVLFGLGPTSPLSNIVTLSVIRLVGATLLHALVSGLFGYFIALSFSKQKRRLGYFFVGLAAATLLHTLFNLSIIELEGMSRILIPLALLGTIAIFVSAAFVKLKEMKSICS